jgi:hypothetical protein
MVVGGLFPALGTINSYVHGDLLEGRAHWIGIFGNPNELAYILVILVPLAAVVASNSGFIARLMLWGAIGQLPVAVAVTLALRWLSTRVRPSLAAIRLAGAVTLEEFAWALPASRPHFATASVARRDVLTAGFSRRGPPFSS